MKNLPTARRSRLFGALLCLVGWWALFAASPARASAGLPPAMLQSAEASTPDVLLVGFDEQLNSGGLSLLRRAIEEAKSTEATIVLRLDTPGGEVQLMWTIAKAIDRARDDGVRIVAWIDKRALSAGALVAMACDYVYMSPTSVIGAAQPILMTPGGPTAVDEKFLSAFRSEWRSWAEAHDRNGALAAGMVDKGLEVLLIDEEGLTRIVDGAEWADLLEREARVRKLRTIADGVTLVSLTNNEALEYGMSDGTAEDLDELLEIKLGLFNAEVLDFLPTSSERLARLLSMLAPMLLAGGILFLFLELQAPGFGLFGILSVVCFIVLLMGRYLTGLAGMEHFAVIGLGLVLLAVELLIVPGTLVAGITGGLLIIGGLIWSQLGSGIPLGNALDRSLAFDAVYTTVVWTSLGAVGAITLSRFLPQTPLLRRAISVPAGGLAFGEAVRVESSPAVQVGALGSAVTDLRPVGKVRLDHHGGVEFEASVDGAALDSGTPVRVTELRTGRLVVEPAGGSKTGTPEHSEQG